MAHGVSKVLSDRKCGVKIISNNNQERKQGSRRIFNQDFKVNALALYFGETPYQGNQRATARASNVHRRQIQKWLQCKRLVELAKKKIEEDLCVVDKNIIMWKKKKSSLEQHQQQHQQQVQQAPALNLSLARLHGDELTSPLSHLTLHQHQQQQQRSSPSLLSTKNSIPIRGQLISYSEHPNPIIQNQQSGVVPSSALAHHQQDNNGMNNYSHDRTVSPHERRYYYPTPPYDQTTVVYCPQNDSSSSSSSIYNQQGACSYQAKSGHGYNGIIVNQDHHNGILGNTGINQSSSHVQMPLSSNSHNRRDIDSPGNDLFMPAERASPDSPASSSSFSSAASSTSSSSSSTCYTSTTLRSSIGVATITTTPQVTTITINPNENNTYPLLQTVPHGLPLHFDTPRQSPDKILFKNELPRILKPKEETTDEHHDIYHSNNNNNNFEKISSTMDVQSRGTLSPGRDVNYLNSQSPRGTASVSSRSTISSCCSDSEIDPHDYSSNNEQNIVNNMPRRRSFFLNDKIEVLKAYKAIGNQRATAKKCNVNRRQVQKWLKQETELLEALSRDGGDSRQRLSASQEVPVDLRTPGGANNNCDIELIDQSSLSPQSYCCDSSSSQRSGYYQSSIINDSDVPQQICTLSCCSDNLTTSSISSNYQESKHDFYHESQASYCCYSPKEQENIVPNENDVNILSPSSKRSACTQSCCYDTAPVGKRQCLEDLNCTGEKEDQQPPQEMPLCLVKPKQCFSDTLLITDEAVSSTVPTPPASSPITTTKKDVILFKPYLDNPISKPGENQRDSSNNNKKSVIIDNSRNVVNNNDNNCHSICNLNEERSHVYSVDDNYRVPVSWGTTHLGYSAQVPDGIRSAFARYPVTLHYS